MRVHSSASGILRVCLVTVAGVSGIIHPYSTQLEDYHQLSPQELSRSKLRAFWLVVVLSGCLDPLRLSLSTLSAHTSVSGQPDKPIDETTDGREVAASYARYSSENQDVASITQQQDNMHSAASLNRHRIIKEYEFYDEAVSGTKLDRKGLNALLEGARSGKFRIIYLWNISRLSREIAIAIPILKELVTIHGVRIISVADGLDSQHASWELQSIFNSFMAQEYLNRLKEDVRRGTRYAWDQGYSIGGSCFGYSTEVIPGQELTSKNRKQRPRKRRIIDLERSPWVIRIFRWYVEELRSINWIRNELNRLGAPKDNRSTSRKAG